MENSDIFQKAYIEVRGATGGDEAKIWAKDLLRMYMRYSLKKGWKSTSVDEGTITVTGPNVFEILKNESGVHRVQRVPTTEKRGRIHTSTATVAVLPEIRETRRGKNENYCRLPFCNRSRDESRKNQDL